MTTLNLTTRTTLSLAALLLTAAPVWAATSPAAFPAIVQVNAAPAQTTGVSTPPQEPAASADMPAGDAVKVTVDDAQIKSQIEEALKSLNAAKLSGQVKVTIDDSKFREALKSMKLNVPKLDEAQMQALQKQLESLKLKEPKFDQAQMQAFQKQFEALKLNVPKIDDAQMQALQKQLNGIKIAQLHPLVVMPGHALLREPADQPPAADELFAGAEKFSKNAKDVNEINLDKKLLGMVDGFTGSGGNGGKGSSLAKQLDFVAVRSYEYGSSDDYNRKDLDAFRARLDNGGWSHVVKERSAKDEEDVWMKGDESNQFSEIVVISAEPRELNFVHIKGHMSLRELTAQGMRYGVPPTALMPGMMGGIHHSGSQTVVIERQGDDKTATEARAKAAEARAKDAEARARAAEARARAIKPVTGAPSAPAAPPAPAAPAAPNESIQ